MPSGRSGALGRGGGNRAEQRQTCRPDLEEPAAPRARLSRLPRHTASGAQYGAERLEAACDRGLDIGARSYGSIQSILKHGLDRRPPKPAGQGELLLPDHPNIRGCRYYH